MINRRKVLTGLTAGLAATSLPFQLLAQSTQKALTMPPLIDSSQDGRFRLVAQEGQVNFLNQSETSTWGFNQSYLGPTLRVAHNSSVQAEVENTLDEAISVHWHGLIIPGEVDGGPHQLVESGATWTPELNVNQPAATLWYHSHVHGKTAQQVQRGLAGVMQITDGQDDERGLPSAYGVDDLTLVLQDRRFDRRGRMDYSPSRHDRMAGFIGNTVTINGEVGATAVVPKGIVRLRLLNGSNARIYTLAMSDGRPMHLIGTDSGLLDRPISLETLVLAPGERYEILVDFGNGADVSLISGRNINTGMMGGGMMGGGARNSTPFLVLPFSIDESMPVRVTSIPTDIGGERPDISVQTATRRSIALEMGMGPSMMLRRSDRRFSINGKTFDMRRINHVVQQSTIEHWTVSADMMMHPFHVHGCAFQVLSENGGAPLPQNTGWKDTVLINGQAEIAMRFDQPANDANPYMFHCHILEHEDGGMMGQFTVT